VAALEPANVRRLIQMASEANFVRSRGRELRRITDLGGIRRFRVLLSASVTGFTGAGCKSPLLAGIDNEVGLLAMEL
jgi:hypothetical protein